MYAQTGFFLILLSLIASVYGCFASILAARKRSMPLMLSAKYAATTAGVFTVAAAILLWIMFYHRDYSVAYIFKNSSNDLPIMYTFTAFWSSLEGSHFFWTLLFAIVSVIAHWTVSKENEHILPYISLSLQFVLVFMFLLAITYSDPFKQIFPTPENGRGMNALLQNPYMAIHPPTLFIGYTALAVPFAYSIAALFYGDVTQGWLKTVRRWSLFAFAILTVGIFLGGRWAYVELGWAGYWAWDPVENSSFIPWIFCTGLLHSLIVQEKMGQLKKISIVLAFFAFFFSFFGTFITRSGVISSVHSFAQSPIGPTYLWFLVVLLILAFTLFAFRASYLVPADSTKVWGLSKESALVLTLFLLLTFGAIVIIGTLMPIASEAITGQKITIQAPYFNAFAPYVGFGFVFGIALGNSLGFQSGRFLGGKRVFILAALLAILPSALFFYFGDVMRSSQKPFAFAMQTVGIYLCFWCTIVLFFDFKMKLAQVKNKWGLFWNNSRAYIGATIAHLGLLVAVLGFLGNFRAMEKLITVNKGDSFEFYNYKFDFDGVRATKEHNADLFLTDLHVSSLHSGKDMGTIPAGKSKYPTKPELLTEVGLRSTFWNDIYVILADYNQEGSQATLKLHINPTVRIVWISCVLMALGALISMFDRFRGQRSRDVVAGKFDIKRGM